jgi:uncharacterized protein YndB with AHSA1/START domain/uncharacterized glyoxalase superfamily protein PhnB
MGSDAPSCDTVTVTRQIAAPAPELWRLWTTPAALRLWWGRSEGGELFECEMDTRVGGALRYAMRARDRGNAPVERVTGMYDVVDPPSRLAFSWVWDGGSEPVDTRVEVTFVPQPAGGSLVTVVHSGQPSARVAAIHRQGWTHMLADLDRAAAAPIRVTDATPVLKVRTMARAIAFYAGVLGAEVLWTWHGGDEGGDPVYTGLRIGEARLHLSSFAGDGAFGTTVYLTVSDVDTLAARIAAGAADALEYGPVDQPWGRRELYVRDPDNNALRFGAPA